MMICIPARIRTRQWALKLCGPLGIQRFHRLTDAVQPQLVEPRKHVALGPAVCFAKLVHQGPHLRVRYVPRHHHVYRIAEQPALPFEVRLGEVWCDLGRGVQEGVIERISKVSHCLASLETAIHLITGKAARRSHGGVVIQLPKKVNTAAQLAREVQFVGCLGVD